MRDITFDTLAIDIETTNILRDSEFILGACKLNDDDALCRARARGMSEIEALESYCNAIVEFRDRARETGRDLRLISYNGRGFDIPFLRSRLFYHDRSDLWPFRDMLHLDLYVPVQYGFITEYYETVPQSLENLKAAQLREAVMCCSLKPASTMAANLELLNGHLNNPRLLQYLGSLGPVNLKRAGKKLDEVYSYYGGPELPEDIRSINGSLVPGLYQKYLDGDDMMLDRLIRYNRSDTDQTRWLFKKIYPMLPGEYRSSWAWNRGKL